MKTIRLEQFESGVAALPKRPVMPDVTPAAGPRWSDSNLSVLFGLKFLSSLSSESGSSFLPNSEGWLEYRPAVNARNGKAVTGLSQVVLKSLQDSIGSDTEVFVSEASLNAAGKAGVQAFVRKGEKGAVLPASSYGDPEQKVTRWFNMAQIEGAEDLKAWLSAERQAALERAGRGFGKFGYGFKGASGLAREISMNESNLTVESYVAQVLASGEVGARLYVSREASEKFKAEAAAKFGSAGWNSPTKEKYAFFNSMKKASRMKEDFVLALKGKKKPRRDFGRGF